MPDRIFRLIPALDTTDLNEAAALAAALGDHPFVYGYKVGFALGLTCGLPRVAEVLRKYSSRPLIYDHQKAATDIPDTGRLFARTLSGAGLDEAILFPQAGPETLRAWIAALQERDLKVIVGGIMTHKAYLVSEGGYLADDRIVEMYASAYELGVRAFVVPLTKPDACRMVHTRLGETKDCEYYSPGYGKQGGDPAQTPFIQRHHIIVGRSLLAADDPLGYVERLRKELEGHA